MTLKPDDIDDLVGDIRRLLLVMAGEYRELYDAAWEPIRRGAGPKISGGTGPETLAHADPTGELAVTRSGMRGQCRHAARRLQKVMDDLMGLDEKIGAALELLNPPATTEPLLPRTVDEFDSKGELAESQRHQLLRMVRCPDCGTSRRYVLVAPECRPTHHHPWHDAGAQVSAWAVHTIVPAPRPERMRA